MGGKTNNPNQLEDVANSMRTQVSCCPCPRHRVPGVGRQNRVAHQEAVRKSREWYTGRGEEWGDSGSAKKVFYE